MKLLALSLTGALAVRVNNNNLDLSVETSSCPWPQELTDQGYTGEHEVGAGATACVFIAHDPRGFAVAVKSSKLPGTLSFWRHECAAMESLRVEACHRGRTEYERSQMYLPTCVSVAGDDQHAYYVMHAAGTQDMETIRTRGLSVEQGKMVFAEMILGIGLLHSLGHTHNDLHGHNIVLDGTALAFIDYGSMKEMKYAKRTGYKRDGNAVWRWTAEIAGCDADALWQEGDPDAMRIAKPKFLQCIADKWAPGEELLDALSAVCDGDIAQELEQHVLGVYNTNFVRQHAPPRRNLYPWSDTDGCLSWDSNQWRKAEQAVQSLEADFTGMTVYQCETVPSFDRVGGQTCRFTPDKPACFSTHKDIYWACMPGITFLGDCATTVDTGGDNFYSGHCVMSNHVNYHQAIPFDPSKFVEKEAPLANVPIGTQTPYKCESIPTWDGDTGVTCRFDIYKAACFSFETGINWVCAGPTGLGTYCSGIRKPLSTETYDGACVMEGHELWTQSVLYDAGSFVKEVPVVPKPVGGCRRRRCPA